MSKIKIGDVVGRISYGKDIFFIVDRIITLNCKEKIAILKGLTVRIKADSVIDDLEKIDAKTVKEYLSYADSRMMFSIRKHKEELRQRYSYGRILHLDGDIRYSQKSVKYYKKIGLNAVVKNVAESRQPRVIFSLLDRYKPDILVVTGHDGMIKSGTGYNDIYNYRNSTYFAKTVARARIWENYSGGLAIFARCMPKLLRNID